MPTLIINRQLPQPTPNRLFFGPLVIEWAPWAAWPIAVNHKELNGKTVFVTATDVTFRLPGFREPITVPRGFKFDGASIPSLFWAVPGFAPLGKHIWAALLHDWLCELQKTNEAAIDRAIADAIFATLLERTGVGHWHRVAMDLAVSGYRRWNALKGLFSGPNSRLGQARVYLRCRARRHPESKG